MAENVFILGAGASVDAGAPVMANFFDVARGLLDGGELKDSDVERAFKNVFAARQALQVVHSKAELDLNNIESVYTALEMAKTIRKFPFKVTSFGELYESLPDNAYGNARLNPDNNPDAFALIKNMIADLKTLIVETLSETVRFVWSIDPVLNRLTMQGSEGSYPDFAKGLKDIGSCAILTFNYDLGLDVSLAVKKLRPVYYTAQNGVASASDGTPVPVLKLHGSLNWAQTDNDIKPLDLYKYVTSTTKSPSTIDRNNLITKLDLNEVFQNQWDSEPVIVPPSWSKSDYQTALTNVWQRAAIELSEARNVYIIGYSLPDTDVFFKLLFGLGTASSEPLQKIAVYNPDSTVEQRFRTMLGPGTEQRYTFKQMKFDEAITDIFGKSPRKTPHSQIH